MLVQMPLLKQSLVEHMIRETGEMEVWIGGAWTVQGMAYTTGHKEHMGDTMEAMMDVLIWLDVDTPV